MWTLLCIVRTLRSITRVAFSATQSVLWELLLWHSAIDGVSVVPGCRFDPRSWQHGLKDPALQQLWWRSSCSSDLIPGPGSPYFAGQPKEPPQKKKKKPYKNKKSIVFKRKLEHGNMQKLFSGGHCFNHQVGDSEPDMPSPFQLLKRALELLTQGVRMVSCVIQAPSALVMTWRRRDALGLGWPGTVLAENYFPTIITPACPLSLS